MAVQWVRKKKIRLTRENRPPSETAVSAAAKFMSVVSDDLLLEILFRLPDYGSVVQCGRVCKRLYSLIFRSGYDFGRCFNHLHRRKRHGLGLNDSNSLPCTFLIRSPTHREESHDFFTEKPKKKQVQRRRRSYLLSFTISSNCLDFLDWSDSAVIRSSFNDLLLVQRTPKRFYICNPITRQCVALPEAPERYHKRTYRCGFVSDPRNSCNEGELSGLDYCNCNIKYKVILVSEVAVSEFSSETGQWVVFSRVGFSIGVGLWHRTPVGINRVLYWPYGNFNSFKGIVAYDLFKDSYSSLRLPAGFHRAGKASDKSARLGAVRGKLRLSQLFWKKEVKSHVLKTWELDEYATARSVLTHWLLKDDVTLRMSDASMNLLALHPDDEDVIFFTREDWRGNVDICRYSIGRDHCEYVHEFPAVSKLPSACVFTLSHPWWPTTIPALPSN